jgi:hypothetical protein
LPCGKVDVTFLVGKYWLRRQGERVMNDEIGHVGPGEAVMGFGGPVLMRALRGIMLGNRTGVTR